MNAMSGSRPKGVVQMIPALPYIALGVAALFAWKAQSAPAPAMSPTQRLIFQNALACDPPLTSAQLKTLAAQYDSQGHSAEASILLKRARIAELPDDQKAALKAAFQKGLNSKDPIGVRMLANAFESEGMFGNAAALRDYANGLDVAATIQTATAQAPATAPSVTQAVGTAVGNAINTAVEGAAASATRS
jgi:hypothetical protein